MPFIEDLAQQTLSQGAGAILGLALGQYNDQRQLKQQQALQDMQIRGNKEMVDYNMAKQLQMWKDTSYPAQLAMMKEAGINPALMYGEGGGGGTTTGTPTGNVTGAEAPKGGQEIQTMMGLQMQAAQLQLLNAQKDNIKADTQQKLATAGKAGIETQIGALDLKRANETYEQSVDRIIAEADIAKKNVNLKDTEIRQREAEATGALLKNALTEAQTRATDQQTQKTISDITKNNAEMAKWTQELQNAQRYLEYAGRDLDQKDIQLAINAFVAKFNAAHPGIGHAIGNIFETTIQGIAKMIGGNKAAQPTEIAPLSTK